MSICALARTHAPLGSRIAVLALLGLVTLTSRGIAGSIAPCDEPFLFPASTVNVIVVPYEITGVALPNPDSQSDDSEAVRDLAWSLELDTLLTAKYGGLGVLTVQTRQAKASGVEHECTADAIVSRLVERRDKYAPQPGQALIIISGLIYQEGEELFLQTELRSMRFISTGQGIAPDVDQLKINIRDSEGIPHKVAASVGTGEVVFPPRRILKSDLNLVSQTFRKAVEVHYKADAPSQPKELNIDLDNLTAAAVEDVDPAGWVKIQPHVIDDLPRDDTTWIRIDSHATQSFHQQMPELDFLSGAIGYFRARQTADEGPLGARAGLAPIAGPTAATFSRYLDNVDTKAGDLPRAAAARMSGVVLALLADNEHMDSWTQARDRFAEAVSLSPESTTARNLLALSNVAMCCLLRRGSDVSLAIEGLTDVLSLQPNNREALVNLEAVYAYLEQEPAAAISAKIVDVSGRKLRISELLRLIDP